MSVTFGAKIKEKDQAAVLSLFERILFPGEQAMYVVKINRVRGMLDFFVLTRWRILALGGVERGVVHDISSADMTGYTLRNAFGAVVPNLSVMTAERTYDFGHVLEKADFEPMRSTLEGVRWWAAQAQSAVAAGGPRADAALVEARAVALAQYNATDEGRLDATDVHGPSLKGEPRRILLERMDGGEVPWFVLNAGNAGVLACFQDCLMIVKAGGMAGWMAGSMGGGRTATIYYREITGIEYNAGMAMGVLEIATASYQASKNKDYWRGSHRSRNANADDPWTLSNTLPLTKITYSQCAAQFNELRRRVSESKHAVVYAPDARAGATAPVPTAAQELSELSALHAQGILTDAEFAMVKAAVISRLSSRG